MGRWRATNEVNNTNMIKDAIGEELTYWPVSIVEGEDSEELTFEVEMPVPMGTISAREDARVRTWCRKAGDPTFTDISAEPLDISSLTGDVDFEIYVEADGPIEGLERIPIPVIVGTSASAGWTA
jgi:hypothetical protein